MSACHSISGTAFRATKPSAQWAGLKGKKNGELLRAAELAGYDVLITVDQGMPHQQNLVGRKLSVVSIRSKTNQVEDLLPFVGAILDVVKTIAPGEIVPIEILRT